MPNRGRARGRRGKALPGLLLGLVALAFGSCQGATRSEGQGLAEESRRATTAVPSTANRAVAAAPRPPDTKDQTGAVAEYPLQSNPLAGCSLCHVDVEDEFVGTIHFDEQVGCITCHGPSAAHLADENNEVQPDELFARGDVDRLCERCHECGRSYRTDPPPNATRGPLVCTDCHGHHALALQSPPAPPSP